jgi:LL-diaminopimelate aminotransferase
VLSRGTWIASGEVFHVKLKRENDFLPDLSEIPEEIAEKAKIFFINYPNNPTAAIAPVEFLEKAVDFCRKYNILLVSDLAYGEVCFDNYRPVSIFEVEGARDVAIEFHSFSKTFNMAGWRVGFAVGKKEFIDIIYAMKSNIDYGTSTLVQDAAIEALTMPYDYVRKIMDEYDVRRELIANNMRNLGWDVYRTPATMYFWLKVPGGYTSKEWCKMVLDKTGVVFTPGIAFGSMSDDHFRFSIVQSEERLKEAFARMEKAGIRYS